MHISSSAMNGLRLRVPLSIGQRPFPRFCRVGRLLVCNSGSEEPGVVLKPTKPRGPILPVSGYRSTPAAAELKTLDVTEASEDFEGVPVAGRGNGTTDSAGHENGNDVEKGSVRELEVVEYDYATLTRTVETPSAAQASAPQSPGGLQRPARPDIPTDESLEQKSSGVGRSSPDVLSAEGGRTLSLIEDLNNVPDESFPADEDDEGSSLVQELNEMFDKTALHKGDELPFKGKNKSYARETGQKSSSVAKDPIGSNSSELERPAPRTLSPPPARPPPARPQAVVSRYPSSPLPAFPGQEKSILVGPPSPAPKKSNRPLSGLESTPPSAPKKSDRPVAGLESTPPSAPSPKPDFGATAAIEEPEVPKMSLSDPAPPAVEPPVLRPTSRQVPPGVQTPVQAQKPPSQPLQEQAVPEAESSDPTPKPEEPISQAKEQDSAVPEDARKAEESPPSPKLTVAPPPKPRPAAPPPRFAPKLRLTQASPPSIVEKRPAPMPAPMSGPKPGRVSGHAGGPVAEGPLVQPKKLVAPSREEKPQEAVSPNLVKRPVQSTIKNIPGVLERLRKKREMKEKRPRKDASQGQGQGPGRKPGRISGPAPPPPTPAGGANDRRKQGPAGAGRQKRKGAREGQFGGTSAENRRKARQQRQERRQARAVTREREEIIEVGPEGMLVSELAEKLLETPADIIKTLFMKGIMVTMTQTLDMDTVKVIGLEYGVDVLEKGEVAIGDMAKKDVEFIDEDDIENLVLRPPVITVMGHVDHGKTSLLDYIRSSSVADREAGGITQAIGAYQCEITVDDEDKTICFLDTPGHEAFSAMRARGTKVTDVAVIIVAADDGLQPQTKEAVSHAKAADVPIIVAINKIDVQGANPERVKQQLGELELIPEEWGGKTPVIPISAKTGDGIDALLEVIVLMAEVELELMANPDRSARGTIVEADLDKRAGPIATMLVQNGTLKVGDIVVSGASVGKVKSLTSDRGVGSTEAGPSTPVRMLGLDSVPMAGDEFQVCETEAEARELAEKAAERIRQAYLAEVSGGGSMVTLSSLASMDDDVEGIQRLNIVLRADTSGAVEAVKSALGQLPQDSVMLRYLHSATGDITESDITLASPADGVIMGFNVEPSEAVLTSAKQKGVEIRSYNVIYDLIDDIRAAMEGRIKSVDEKVPIGSAEVRAVFGTGSRTVAGCMVTDGHLEKGAVIEVKRKKKKVVYEGELKSLRRVKDIVNSVEMGLECGVGCDYVDWQEGDIIEAYTLVKKSLSLEEAHAPTAITLEELELELAESNE